MQSNSTIPRPASFFDSACRAWRAQRDVPLGGALLPAPTVVDGATLLKAATECAPPWLLERREQPLRLRVRQAAGSNAAVMLELRIDGVFRATIDFSAGTSSGQGLVPQRVGIGPSDVSHPLGAAQPPKNFVYRDLCARAGAILAGLDALPPRQRLFPLLCWLSSLHSVLEDRCVGCGEARGGPGAYGDAALLPPTARCGKLRPYHASCFCAAGLGVSPEAAFAQAWSGLAPTLAAQHFQRGRGL